MSGREFLADSIPAVWSVPGHVRALTTTRATQVGSVAGCHAGGRGTARAQAVARHQDELRAATTGRAGHLQWLRQVHGSRCIRATLASCAAVPEADAAWTDETDLGLVIQTADCVPVAIADLSGERVGVAHAGWRGLVGGVLGRLIESLGGAASLVAWIGPAIGPRAYEVGPDVHRAVHSACGAALAREVLGPGIRKGKWQLDLYALSARLLALAGVTRVYGERLCTYSDPRFYSYRRDGTTGRMATVVWKSPR